MTALYLAEVTQRGNNVRDSIVKLGAVPRSPLFLTHQTEAFQLLTHLTHLSELEHYLPLEYYFERHFVGTDSFSNASLVRHIDFESKGRGGLHFKLERLYSSLGAYSLKGEYLINSGLKPFFQELRAIVSSEQFRDGVLEWLCEVYRQLFIETRDIVNVERVGPGSEGAGPQYENTTLFPDVDSLIHSYDVLAARFTVAGGGPSWLLLAIDAEKRLHLYLDALANEELLQNLLPPGARCPLPALIIHLRLMRDDLLHFITVKREAFDLAISEIDSTESIYIDSILGDGWSFNLPFIKPPASSTSHNGFIFFDGYIKVKYANEPEKRIPEKKGYILRLSYSPEERDILDRFLHIYQDDTVTQQDIDHLEYRFSDVDNRYYYFDIYGRLRFITDSTHNNIIFIEYQNNVITRIIDAAGNTYTFQYGNDNKLQYIESSYGRIVEYNVRRVSSAQPKYLLDTVIDGNHQTGYRYKEYQLYQCPLFPDSEASLQFLTHEYNPAGGKLQFEYYEPIYESISAGFSRESIASADPDLQYVLGTPPTIERIYRNNDRSDIVVGHSIIEEGIVESLPWTPRFRRTVSIYKEHVKEHEYRDFYGKMKLFSVQQRNFKWNPVFNTDFQRYTDYVEEETTRSTHFRYYPGHLIREKTINQGSGGMRLTEKYTYPLNPDLSDTYGLPETVTFSQGAGFEVIQEFVYSYFQQLPLVTEVKGDQKAVTYEYFLPSEQDPAGCRKPTVIIEETNQPPYRIETNLWYDEYGNLIQVENALKSITRYEYLDNNGLPDTFLQKVVQDGKNA